jgi:protein SCO1/2
MTSRVFLLLLGTLAAFSCSRKDESKTDLVTFPLRGVVVGIDTTKQTLTVAHEAIPNYMSAMTMPFRVHDRALLYPLARGDSIQATLAVSHTESWLEAINVIGRGPLPATMTAGDIIMNKVLKPGDIPPDDAWLNQDGTQIRLRSWRGKVVALTFIYTRCPLPDFCIRMSSQFAAIQRTLGADPHMAGQWHLLSVSFDPALDRPPVLKRYAQTYQADFATWDFLTDPDTTGPSLRRLADGVGLSFTGDEGLFDHNLRTVLLDKDGKLFRVIQGNEWKAEEVAGEMKNLAAQ